MPFSGSETGKYAMFALCEELCVIILNERRFRISTVIPLDIPTIWLDFWGQTKAFIQQFAEKFKQSCSMFRWNEQPNI